MVWMAAVFCDRLCSSIKDDKCAFKSIEALGFIAFLKQCLYLFIFRKLCRFGCGLRAIPRLGSLFEHTLMTTELKKIILF